MSPAQDAVPRASLHTASRLQDEVVEALARGRRCKASSLLSERQWVDGQPSWSLRVWGLCIASS